MLEKNTTFKSMYFMYPSVETCICIDLNEHLHLTHLDALFVSVTDQCATVTCQNKGTCRTVPGDSGEADAHQCVCVKTGNRDFYGPLCQCKACF